MVSRATATLWSAGTQISVGIPWRASAISTSFASACGSEVSAGGVWLILCAWLGERVVLVCVRLRLILCVFVSMPGNFSSVYVRASLCVDGVFLVIFMSVFLCV